MPWSVVLMLAASSGVGDVEGNGVEGHDKRSLGPFDTVHNELNVDVVVARGVDPGASIKCDDNLIALIRTEVVGKTLTIEPPEGTNLRPRSACRVDVTVPSLEALGTAGSGSISTVGPWPLLHEIDLAGSGNGNVSALLVPALLVRVSGSGSVTLSGAADFVHLELIGSGRVAARELKTKNADIEITGSGDTELTASGKVDVRLSGSGDVRLWGNPALTENVTGSGRIRRE